jgi:hypothetical protein
MFLPGFVPTLVVEAIDISEMHHRRDIAEEFFMVL